MPFGAELLAGGSTRFRLWAPGAARLRLALQVRGGQAPVHHDMHALEGGWHELTASQADAGSRYRFVLESGLAVPDPASRFNPEDVQGPSQVTDPLAYAWQDAGWVGRAWHEAVVYELHVGAFTPEGTYAAAQARLAELAALGITAIELMPLASFSGQRGWGYDGVLPFAPDASYGQPDELKALVDHAHALGLMVLLDVVYNHFGPEGNHLHAYCEPFFNPAHQTPWGAAINFDGEQRGPVRSFYVHNALYWTEEFHFDGLRLDAVHAIRDDSPEHIVREIAHALQRGPGLLRQVHLVLENDANEAHHLGRDASGRPVCATAQWNDDLHHAAHVLIADEVDGYYADYAEQPLQRLARCLAEGFAYQGEPSALRDGLARGEPSAHLPPLAFVSFLQNHDQIGNRAFGERLDSLATTAQAVQRLETALACLLLSPHVPMLFMGEEFAATSPFLYFCDFHAELAEAVASGRRAEFKRFAAFEDAAARARIPDPNALASFTASKLRWHEREQGPHAERLALVARLLSLRKELLTPLLASAMGGGSYRVEDEVMRVQWPLGKGARWQLVANFGDSPAGVAEAEADTATGAPWLRVLPPGGDAPAALLAGGVWVRLEPGNV